MAEFAEHGYLVHTQAYPECLRIPLIVVAPGRPGARVARVVETVDFAPTLYELTGVAPPPGLWARAWRRHSDAPTRSYTPGFAYAENDLLGFEERSILQAVEDPAAQLYRAHAVFESDGFWVSRRVGFDAHPPWLRAQGRHLPEPRPVTVYAGDRKIAEIELGVD